LAEAVTSEPEDALAAPFAEAALAAPGSDAGPGATREMAPLETLAAAVAAPTRATKCGLVERATGAAADKVFGAKARLSHKVSELVDFAQGKVASAVELAQKAKHIVKGFSASMHEAATAAREGLKRKGMKAFVMDGTASGWRWAHGTITKLANTAAEAYGKASQHAVESATEAAKVAQTKAAELKGQAHSVAMDRKFQVSAASAASGAVALGASGGATGLAAGGAFGAAIGLVPALFTFGLSVPIGAAIGGGAGLVVGTAVGGTIGAVGGGAAGYGAYSKKDDFSEAAQRVKVKAAETMQQVRGSSTAAYDRAREAADTAKAQAYASAGYMAEKASAAKSRLVGRSSTGGTEAAE